jgi:hypothetical protein
LVILTTEQIMSNGDLLALYQTENARLKAAILAVTNEMEEFEAKYDPANPNLTAIGELIHNWRDALHQAMGD